MWARYRFATPRLRSDLQHRKHNPTQSPATHQPDGQITQNLSIPQHKNIPLNLSGKSAA